MPPTRPSLAARLNQAAEQLGGLDLLVATPAARRAGGLLDSTPEDCSATFAVNALQAAHAIRCAVPHFERRGAGAALIIASITGWKPGPKSSYAAHESRPCAASGSPQSVATSLERFPGGCFASSFACGSYPFVSPCDVVS